MEILSCSNQISYEYCCTVVKIGDITPIEGTDFLATTMVEGRIIVIRKDMVKSGDIMIYASNESAICQKFLSINNQFDDKSLNSNKEVRGYFNKNGRVRMIKLKGQVSMGYLFDIDSLVKYNNKCSNIDFNSMIGTDFDTVDNELFIKAYMPPIKENKSNNGVKKNNRIKKFNRMIEGQFSFHYDTQQLQRNMDRITPDDNVTITLKIHGTSCIIGNVLVKTPKFGGLYKKIFNYLPSFLQFTNDEYDIVYSSRSVIKNSDINPNVGNGYYGTDIWGEYYKIIKDYIPKDMTIYGEIFGYMTDSSKMIQKDYDYGCKEGTNKLMIYRITTLDENGKHKEWNIQDIYYWTIKLINNHPNLEKYIHPIDILYHGALKDLYPNLNIKQHWRENVLEELKNDTVNFGMEKNEPLCNNKVPREGIVLRIDDDPIAEAFKLKCIKFLSKEAESIDKGNYNDIESSERYEP